MKKRKKALFVTHDISLYGASRSLQTLLTNLEDTDIDLIVKRRFFRKRNQHPIRSFFNYKLNQVQEFYLPMPDCFKGSDTSKAVVSLNNAFWQSNRTAFYQFVKENDYDYIHLNSLVLHQLIHEDLPFFIHIREILNKADKGVFESIQKAKGVIFIDEATEKPFKALELENSRILNNPFDMRSLNSLHFEGLQDKYQLASKTVFSIIGSVAEIKGVHLAIKAFREVKSRQALLFIVGNGKNAAYNKLCRELSSDDPRIIFYGEEPEIGKIYAISDYILRCDPQFCIGRTVYEGLYAGCNVILPGEEADRAALFDMEQFSENITFYPPEDVSTLRMVLDEKSQLKVTKRAFSTNIVSHLKQFSRFIDSKLKAVQA